MVMDKVAFNMSYGNVEVRKMVNSFYHNPYLTYDETIRKMQAENGVVTKGGSLFLLAKNERKKSKEGYARKETCWIY